MTVRELADWLLDLQVWQAILLMLAVVPAVAFFGGFGRQMAKDLGKRRKERM